MGSCDGGDERPRGEHSTARGRAENEHQPEANGDWRKGEAEGAAAGETPRKRLARGAQETLRRGDKTKGTGRDHAGGTRRRDYAPRSRNCARLCEDGASAQDTKVLTRKSVRHCSAAVRFAVEKFSVSLMQHLSLEELNWTGCGLANVIIELVGVRSSCSEQRDQTGPGLYVRPLRSSIVSL